MVLAVVVSISGRWLGDALSGSLPIVGEQKRGRLCSCGGGSVAMVFVFL